MYDGYAFHNKDEHGNELREDGEILSGDGQAGAIQDFGRVDEFALGSTGWANA